MTIDELNNRADVLFERLNGWQIRTLQRIGRRIKATGKVSAADQKALKNIADITGDMEQIKKDLASVTGQNVHDVQVMYEQAMQDTVKAYKPIFDFKNIEFLPFSENAYAQSIVSHWVKETASTMINLSRTKALSISKYGLVNGEKVPVGVESLAGAYQNAIDKAVFAVNSGVTDFNYAMRDTILELGGSGIRVNYGSGVTRPLDSVIRQNILYSVKEMAKDYDEQISEQLGCDGFEVNFSRTCRPSHTFMEGKMFSYNGEKKIDGVTYPDGAEALERLNDYNCNHRKISVILGVSESSYDQKTIADMQNRNMEEIEYNGITKTRYEWIQQQRRIERNVREQKNIYNMAKASGDSVLMRDAENKINAYRAKYNDLCEKVGIVKEPERMAVNFKQSNHVLTDDIGHDRINTIYEKPQAPVQSINSISFTLRDTTDKSRILTQQETIARAKEFAKSSDYNGATSFQDIRAITNKKLGYDDLPEILNEVDFDNLVANRQVLYRGIRCSKTKSASEIISEFKYGKLWTGNTGGAIYGNGVYFTKTRLTAENHSDNKNTIISAILQDDAKVVDYAKIYKEFEKTGIPKIIGGLNEDYQYIIRDVGQYAALKGYDAISANKMYGSDHDYLIVLNRKKLIIKE